jgi:hypothetical protein
VERAEFLNFGLQISYCILKLLDCKIDMAPRPGVTKACSTASYNRRDAMNHFIQRFSDRVTGILNGYDRLMIHGNLRRISYPVGMKDFLCDNDVLLKEFGKYAEKVSEKIRQQVKSLAMKAKRPLIHVNSSRQNKEHIALDVARQDKVKEGLIATLSCVESCRSYGIEASRERKEINLKVEERKCLHFYQYMFHPEFGFMYGRLQTWFPFKIEIYLNGREWLARRMDQCGLKYKRLDNCFSWIEDFERAQQLMNQQLRINWPGKLGKIAHQLNPAHDSIFEKYPLKYYWSIAQSEWATDIAFKDRNSLAEIYRPMILHGITNFGSKDVLRFLSKKLHGNFVGEATSDFKIRSEGVRIKHRIDTNSIKLYDKFGLVLRVEMTINNARALMTYRPIENHPERGPVRAYLRVGIADIVRRSQICQRANENYLEALAVVEKTASFCSLLERISRPTTYNGRSVRGLRPWQPDDFLLLKTIAKGEFTIAGFRNRDLQQVFFQASPINEKEKRRRSAKISRLLRILRAHHIIRKIPSSYRYTLTTFGRDLINAILSTQNLTLSQLQNAVAA